MDLQSLQNDAITYKFGKVWMESQYRSQVLNIRHVDKQEVLRKKHMEYDLRFSILHILIPIAIYAS